MVSGVLPAFFLFNQALLSNFQNRPGGHVYLEGHVYLAGKSRGKYNRKVVNVPQQFLVRRKI